MTCDICNGVTAGFSIESKVKKRYLIFLLFSPFIDSFSLPLFILLAYEVKEIVHPKTEKSFIHENHVLFLTSF